MNSDELTKALEELLKRSALLETGIVNLDTRLDAIEKDSFGRIITVV